MCIICLQCKSIIKSMHKGDQIIKNLQTIINRVEQGYLENKS